MSASLSEAVYYQEVSLTDLGTFIIPLPCRISSAESK